MCKNWPLDQTVDTPPLLFFEIKFNLNSYISSNITDFSPF